MTWSALACLTTLPLLLGAAPAAPTASPPWLLISDLHFNPFATPSLVAALAQHPAAEWHALLEQAGGSLSTYGEDSNYPLLALSLREMKARVKAPAVVIIAGDLLVHDFRGKLEHAAPPGAEAEPLAEKSVAFLALELGAAFPDAQFVLALGNNDSTCGDYCVEPGGAFLAAMAKAWEPLVNRGGRAPGFAPAFAAGELYSVRLPLPGAPELLALDSIPWSRRSRGGDSRLGEEELQKLSSMLESSHPAWRWFVLHIPPGPDSFSSDQHHRPQAFLDERAEKELVQRLSRPSGRGALLVAGHSHHAYSNLLHAPPLPGSAEKPPPLPMLALPAISPIFRNNPGFVVAQVDPASGAATQVSRYALLLDQPAPKWVEEGACWSGPFTAEGLTAHQLSLMHAPESGKAEMSCWCGQSQGGAAPVDDWAWFLCAEVAEDPSSYCGCIDAQHSKAGGCPAHFE